MNTAASDKRHRNDGESDFARSDQRGRQRLLAHFHVPENVFQHDDGVVDDEADREDQRHHRQVVQAVIQQVHHGERADDRERQRQAGNHRRRDIAQEQEDDRDHQAQRQQHGELDVLIGFANGVGTVVENVHVRPTAAARP